MKINKGITMAFVAVVAVGILCSVVAFIVDHFIGVLVTGFFLGAIFLTYRKHILPSLDQARILRTGIKAIGTILSISETTTWINNAPVLKIEMEVNTDGKPKYITQVLVAVSYFDTSTLLVGKQVEIVVDPKNSMTVQIIPM